jgi:hypothetical protein
LLGSEFQTVWIILPRPGGNGGKLAVISPNGDETGTELAKESESRTPDEEHRPLCHAELRGCSSTKGDVWGVVRLGGGVFVSLISFVASGAPGELK